jgi:hypothetical protein
MLRYKKRTDRRAASVRSVYSYFECETKVYFTFVSHFFAALKAENILEEEKGRQFLDIQVRKKQPLFCNISRIL